MATPSDITVTPLTGLNHIDALLDKGPDWNFLSNNNANVLFYTFSITSGNESDRTGQEAFSASQQANARTAFSYLQQVTGIQFQETASGTSAQFHLANLDLDGAYTTGLNSWISQRSGTETTLSAYNANAYVYLDNAEWRGMTQNLTVGTQGYETLLHELGHALGLKHPFPEPGDEGLAVLPGSEDNTSNTIMSYTSAGGWHSTYRPYDIAALNWLYGGDGLRGELGINSTTGGRYITGSFKADTLMGTQFNDTLQGNGGSDMMNGGDGIDTVIYGGNRSAYALANLDNGALSVTSAQGVDTLVSVEQLRFADMVVSRASILDTTPPPVPTMAVTKNGAMYARGNMPNMNGSAEANALVQVFIGEQLIATARADASGLWSARSTVALADGLNYRAYAKATDASGNTSGASDLSVFNVDATQPTAPTMTVSLSTGSNQPQFSGAGEAGTTIELYRNSDGIKFGSAIVGSDGAWKLAAAPLPNGVYDVIGAAVDIAGNATAMQAGSNVTMTINHAGNLVGTGNADTFSMGAGNIAIDGGGGIDTVAFSGARAQYTITKGAWGHAVTDASGIDGLYNIERLHFSDSWLALDDGTAQVFRLYQAAFGRASDSVGMGYWIDRMDKGASLLTIANEFTVNQAEFDRIYGANPTDEVFISNLYQNVLHRAPDADGFAYWLMRADNSSKAQILVEFSESPENQAQVVGVTSTGMEFTPWQPVKPAVELVGVMSADLAFQPAMS
jgi:serralysin